MKFIFEHPSTEVVDVSSRVMLESDSVGSFQDASCIIAFCLCFELTVLIDD